MNEHLDSLCIGELASVVYRQYQSYINQCVKKYGITFAEFAYILKIPVNETVSQSYIAERLFCDNAAMTRILQTLEQKGLVERQKTPNDKRTVMVSLTAKGAEVRKIGMNSRKKWKKLVMSDISADEETMLISTIRAISKQALSVAKQTEMEGKL